MRVSRGNDAAETYPRERASNSFLDSGTACHVKVENRTTFDPLAVLVHRSWKFLTLANFIEKRKGERWSIDSKLKSRFKDKQKRKEEEKKSARLKHSAWKGSNFLKIIRAISRFRAGRNDATRSKRSRMSVRPVASDGPMYLLRFYRIPIFHSHYAELFYALIDKRPLPFFTAVI